VILFGGELDDVVRRQRAAHGSPDRSGGKRNLALQRGR
jgi:hypothetical protein